MAGAGDGDGPCDMGDPRAAAGRKGEARPHGSGYHSAQWLGSKDLLASCCRQMLLSAKKGHPPKKWACGGKAKTAL